MPNLNFNDSVYIGTPDGLVGISMNDQTSLITYNGGLVNNGSYIYPINNILGGASSYTASSAQHILLISASGARGASNTLFLGNQSNGKIFYLRRIDLFPVNYTIRSSGTDVIRVGSTNSVTSFVMSNDSAYTLTYNSGTWWIIRSG